jgi:ABC-type phosphate transport system permease subunit
MLLPTLATLADDALQGVPAAAREAARGLGLTRAETVTSVVVPQALPALLGAFLLALGRALGETTAVFLVVGRADGRLPESLASLAALLSPGQTLTTKLGGPEVNLSMGDPQHRGALLALALVLLVGVLAATLAGLFLRRTLAREEVA